MNKKAKLKICGLKYVRDAHYINETGADYAGFIFVKSSSRYINQAVAKNIRRALKPEIISVGVFQNADMDFVMEPVKEKTVGAVQLHGDESEDYITELRGLIDNEECGDVPIIKAVRVEDAESFAVFETAADYLLFDNGAGGTGESFGMNLLDVAQKTGCLTKVPFFIAGGIDAENVHEALARTPFGIDVSSGLETLKSKDPIKIRKFISAFNAGNNVIGSVAN
jgi:phosphoribosylanthranilate isomerase